MTLDAALDDSVESVDTVDLDRLIQTVPKVSADTWVPPRIRQDWPQLDFGNDAVRGVVTEAMGIQLSSVFQPIVDINRKVVAEEALLRARSYGVQIPPLSVFRIAAAHGQLVAFDRLARTLHLLNYLAYPRNHERLFLNVHPRLLGEVSTHGVVFEEILSSVHWSPQQVTLEFLEDDVAMGDFSRLRDAARNYRSRGFGIAIDDFGGERLSRLDSIWELEPDVVKIERQLLLKSESSSRIRNSLKHLVELLHQLGAQVVMEGVETLSQHQIALDAGVDLLQGFYYGEPKSIGTR